MSPSRTGMKPSRENPESGSHGEQPLDLDDALAYLKHVKDTLLFQNHRDEYDMFCGAMKDFKARRIDTDGLIRRVKALLNGHGSLILGLNRFLPKGYVITLSDDDGHGSPETSTVEFEEAVDFMNKLKHRFQDDNKVYTRYLDILRMFGEGRKGVAQVHVEVAALLDDHPDLLEEFTRFLPDIASAEFGRHSRPYNQPGDEARGAKAYKRRAVCDLDDDRSMMKSHKETRERTRRDHRETDVEKPSSRLSVRRKSSSARWQFEEIGGVECVDKEFLKIMYSQGFSFCEKVKEKLCDPGDYQAFLKCLHLYSTGIGTREDIQNLVADLLGGCPDLMQGFDAFLELCENIYGAAEDDRYSGKCIQDVDLSNCRRCTPSYRLIPDDYPTPSVSGRDELGRQVLNDLWVCVPMSCNEYYSFKHKRMSDYEERMFRCEDKRLELDMLSELLNSTVTNVEKLLNNNINTDDCITSPAEEPTVIDIKEHLTARNLQCIERLYGDHGAEFRKEILSRNPHFALPIVLTRLKQKREELTKCRADFSEAWADEIYARNHDKSLDRHGRLE